MVKSLILCEGGDDVGFLNKFCKYLKLDKKIVIQKISKESLNSAKSAFFKETSYIAIRQKIKIGQYDKILFIVDADYIENDKIYGGYESTKNELEKIILKLDFDKNKTNYFIMCDPVKKTGNLEHLILSTIDNPKKNCIIELLDCVSQMEVHSNKKIVLSSYEAIFKESPYNLTHSNFRKLKTLLENLGATDEKI